MAAPSENLERIVHKMKRTEMVCDQLLDENHAKNEDFLNSTFAKLRKRKQQQQRPESGAGQSVAKKPKMAQTSSSTSESEEDYSKYSYAQIRTMCKEQGLPGKGKREVLEERLMQHFRQAKSDAPAAPAQSSETAEVIAHALAAAAQAEQARLEQARLEQVRLEQARLAEEEERIRQAEEEEQAEAARLAAVAAAAAAAQQERLRLQALASEKARRDAAALEQALKEEQEAAEEERLAELNRQMRSQASSGDILKKLAVAPAGAKLFAVPAPAAAAAPTVTPGGGRVFVSGSGGSALAGNKSNLSASSFGSLFKPTNASQNQSSNSFAHDVNKSSSSTMASFLKSSGASAPASTSSASASQLFDFPPSRVPAQEPPPAPAVAAVQPEESEYQFSDPDDYKSESENDSDEDENKESMQKVPVWAKGEALKQALKVQYERYQDLDEIFPDNRNPVEFPLEEIFKKKTGMRPRSSSAIWTHDAVTTEQRLEYQSSSMKPPKH